ncbi:hypothetical protein GC101_17665 [Paenibacillus sp. LMG 31459]|uniref:Uncharacterized protein n=1 Tax=Paenibacillus phytohabitans TaxID=2654978 RepID=A0ABX1YK09_9BACL|nr:hypothetical protein [Paenibacillus phytohabitans]
MNLKTTPKKQRYGGGIWNCRSDSVRLKAFRRKARFGSISSHPDFHRDQRYKFKNPGTTAAGSPNIHRSGD